MAPSAKAAGSAYSTAAICNQVMGLEEIGRNGNAAAVMLRDELVWQDEVDGVSAAEDGVLLNVLKQLEVFDETCRLVRAATDKTEAKQHAKKRTGLCRSQDTPVNTCIEAQEARLETMRTRLQRVAASLEKLDGTPLVVLKGPPTAEEEATFKEKQAQMGEPPSALPPPTEASRKRLREQLDRALEEFSGSFNVLPDAVSVLGPQIIEPLTTLRGMATDDASVMTALLVRGRSISTEESNEIEEAVKARDLARTALQKSLVEELRKAEAVADALSKAARLYLQLEKVRISGSENTGASPTDAPLMDAKTAVRMEEGGMANNIIGLQTMLGLLKERLEELRRLPVLEKEASKLWRRVKRAEKMVVRIFVMKRSWQNRHDEAVEYGEISSESDDDDLDDDEEFDIHDPEEVKKKIERLTAKSDEKKKYGEEGRLRLSELAVALPEYKLELQETPRAMPENY